MQEALVFTTKVLVKLGMAKTRAVAKANFKVWKALVATSVQLKLSFF